MAVMNVILTFLPLMLFGLINVGFGIAAIFMAEKRGLNSVPAFFAAFFGSFIAIFIIAMFPKKR